jgi:hypothetical protein
LRAVVLLAAGLRAVVLLPAGLRAVVLLAAGLRTEDLAAPVLVATRALLVDVLVALALAAGLLTVRPVTLVLRARLGAVFAAPRRAGFRVVACRGIDLPP